MYVNFIINRCDDFMQYFMETFINLLENNPYTSNLYNQFCFKYKILAICFVNIEHKIMLKSFMKYTTFYFR